MKYIAIIDADEKPVSCEFIGCNGNVAPYLIGSTNNIKALNQEPCEDVMAIHTQGLDEGIRCAMCTNSMKSDRGCDGGCVVNEYMYREVMNTIENHIVPPVTPTQEPILDKIKDYINHIRGTGLGKKKSLEFIEKYIDGLKAESEKQI